MRQTLFRSLLLLVVAATFVTSGISQTCGGSGQMYCYLQNVQYGSPCWISAECTDGTNPCGAGSVYATCDCNTGACQVSSGYDGQGGGYVQCEMVDGGQIICTDANYCCFG